MIDLTQLRLDQTLLILLFSLAVAIIVAGILIYRFRIFDRKAAKDRYTTSPVPSPSKTLGKLMIIIFGILAFVMLMVMIMTFVES